MVTGDLIDALGLPLPVRGAEAVGGLVPVG